MKKNPAIKIRLYSLKNKEKIQDSKNEFVLQYETDKEAEEDFKLLLQAVNVSNNNLVRVGCLIFQKDLFDFALLEL